MDGSETKYQKTKMYVFVKGGLFSLDIFFYRQGGGIMLIVTDGFIEYNFVD